MFVAMIILPVIDALYTGLGYTMVITNTCIGIYYNVIIAWSMYFFFASMTDILPWETCDNWWNTGRCTTTQEFRNYTLSELIHRIAHAQ